MKGYKAFDGNLTCLGFQYQVGETYAIDSELKICNNGFHFCKDLLDVYAFYPFDSCTRVAEVEACGDIQQRGIKYVTNKIKIIKEVRYPFFKVWLKTLLNNGKNLGGRNIGTSNIGYNNFGVSNRGSYNNGCYNQGWFNSGEANIGSDNSGNSNIGLRNVGCYNIGSDNNGSYNIGDFNSGENNIGDFNSGENDIGIFNSGTACCGAFNTISPKPKMFDKEVDMSYNELRDLFYHNYGTLERIYSGCVTLSDIAFIRQLPNFDEKIFQTITGIDLIRKEKGE